MIDKIDFEPLLDLFKENNLEECLKKKYGVTSWKLLLIEDPPASDFSVTLPPPVGVHFILLLDPKGLTQSKVRNINTEIINNFTSKVREKINKSYSFRVHTKTSFQNEYEFDNQTLEEKLKKADTLDNLIEKVSKKKSALAKRSSLSLSDEEKLQGINTLGLFSAPRETPIPIPQEILDGFKGAFELLNLAELVLKERDRKIIQSFLKNKDYTPEQIVFFARELAMPEPLINSIDVIYCALHPEKWETSTFKEHKQCLLDDTAKFSLPTTATKEKMDQCITQLKEIACLIVSKFVEESITLNREEEEIKNHLILKENKSKSKQKISNKISFKKERKKFSKGIVDDYLEAYSDELESHSLSTDSDSNSPRDDIEIKDSENKLQQLNISLAQSQKEKKLWEALDYFGKEWKDIYTLIKFSKTCNAPRDEAKMFQVVKAILYHEQTQVSWKSLPQDFITGGQAYYYKRLWEKEGKLENIMKIALSSKERYDMSRIKIETGKIYLNLNY